MPITPRLNVFISHASGEHPLATLLKESVERDFIGLIHVFGFGGVDCSRQHLAGGRSEGAAGSRRLYRFVQPAFC